MVNPVTGDLKDTLIARRLFEGYRMLVPSYCDHDLYLGDSTRLYPDNRTCSSTAPAPDRSERGRSATRTPKKAST